MMALSTQNAATARIQQARAECRLTLNHDSLLHLNSRSTAGVRGWRRGLNICIGEGFRRCKGFAFGADSSGKKKAVENDNGKAQLESPQSPAF